MPKKPKGTNHVADVKYVRSTLKSLPGGFESLMGDLSARSDVAPGKAYESAMKWLAGKCYDMERRMRTIEGRLAYLTDFERHHGTEQPAK